MNKLLISAAVLCALSVQAMAQSATQSPYSQFGLGTLADQSQGMSRGMAGLSMGLRSGYQVNALNPASYSATDSLTMIFDVGLSGQVTNFKEGNQRLNANSASFEYAVGMFRLMPKVGVGLGIMPYSNVGYDYYSTSNIGPTGEGLTQDTQAQYHQGSGGISQVFVGIGWEVLKNLSVGANFSYLFGTYDRLITVSNSDTYVNTVTRQYSTSVNNYKLDFGAQYLIRLNKTNTLTLGATYGLGHNLTSDPTFTIMSTNNTTGDYTETSHTAHNALSIPHSFAFGGALNHKNKLIVGVDYSLQKWGELDYPDIDYSNGGSYVLKSGLLSDRHKVTVGGEFIPNAYSSNFLLRTRYRLGASMATPYFKVNGQDGPKEFTVTAGFGIMLWNSKTRPSLLNISGQWTRSEATGLITENMFRINIGLTFNERWFAKWKFE